MGVPRVNGAQFVLLSCLPLNMTGTQTTSRRVLGIAPDLCALKEKINK